MRPRRSGRKLHPWAASDSTAVRITPLQVFHGFRADPPRRPFDAWLAALDERHLADFTADGSGSRAAGAVVLLRRAALPAGRGRGARDRRQARRVCAVLRAPPLPDRRPHRAARCPRRRRSGGARSRVRDRRRRGCLGAAVRRPAASPASTAIPGRSPKRTGPTGSSGCTAGPSARTSRGSASIRRAALGILAAYTINELPDDLRSAWLTRLLDARARGATVLDRRTHRPAAGAVVARLGGTLRRRRRPHRRMALRRSRCPAGSGSWHDPPASIRVS